MSAQPPPVAAPPTPPEPSPWPDDRLEADKRDSAVIAAILLLHWRKWVHRRTETVEFIDEAHLRRRHTVDFSIPFLIPEPHRTTLIPVALLGKRTLQNFDLRGSDGRALSMLTLKENVLLGDEILQRVAELVLGSRDEVEKDEELKRLLHAIVASDTTASDAALKQLEQSVGPVDHDRLDKLNADSRMQALALDLASKFVMYVPVSEPVGTRCIVKFEYDEPLSQVDEEAPKAPQTVTAPDGQFYHQWAMALWDRFLISTALRPKSFSFYAPSISAAQSYHVEVRAPDDLIIKRATLIDLETKELLCGPVEAVDRAHLGTRDRHRGSTGWIEVTFSVRSSTVYRAARNISVATTLLLFGGLAAHFIGLHPKAEVAAVVLAILPGGYAAYLARPGEHRLVQQLAAGVRWLIALQAVLSFLGAATLALEATGETPLPGAWRVVAWTILGTISAVGSFITLEGNRRAARIEKRAVRR